MPAAAQLAPNAWSSMPAAGALYAIGMILFITRRPRLRPAVFSYHEVLHLLVVVADAIHFWVVARFLAPLGSWMIRGRVWSPSGGAREPFSMASVHDRSGLAAGSPRARVAAAAP
jgi:hypothetical protein